MIRPTYRVWGSSQFSRVVDPDLNPTHPSGNGGPGKYAKGWIVETEPHEWANFVHQQADLSFGELLTQGHLSWDAAVNYIKGSLVFHNGTAWNCTLENINQAPVDGSTYWETHTASMSMATWLSFYNAYVTDFNAHINAKGPAQNPHDENITKTGGYNTATIDSKFKIVSDTASNHFKNFANPHGVTPAQVNCLPAATGGTFTGLVTMYRIDLGNATKYVDALNGTISLGTSAARVGIKDNLPKEVVKNEELLTEESYPKVRAKHEIKFSTREPEFEIPLQGSLNALAQGNYTLEFSRPSTLSYTDRAGVARTAGVDEPAFTERGLLLTADTIFGIRTLWSGAATIQLYRDNIPELWDTALTDGNLIAITGTTGSINNLRVWQGPLTIYEKSTRGG